MFVYPFVYLCGQCLEDSSSHWPFPEGRARWSTGLGGLARAGEGGTGGEGPGGGELDKSIMHRVHTSPNNLDRYPTKSMKMATWLGMWILNDG
jgi:hypothetical protein